MTPLATVAAATGGGGGGGMSILILALPILLLFYLMWSQRRRARRLAESQDAIKVGDEVLTTAGMYGTVTGIDGDVVHLQIANGVIVRNDRRAVVPAPAPRPAGEQG